MDEDAPHHCPDGRDLHPGNPGIHFETIPFKFTLKMAGNTYACTRAGIVVDCTNG